MTRDEVARLDEVVKTLATLVGRFDEQEKIRTTLRKVDEERWGEIQDEMADIKAHITEMPCMMDAKIESCRKERIEDTEPTVRIVTQLKDFGIVSLKIGAAAGVITGAVFGVGKIFGWM